MGMNGFCVNLGKPLRMALDGANGQIPLPRDVEFYLALSLFVHDMTDPGQGRKLFPQARIVAEQFHVLRLVSPSIIKERRMVQENVFDARTMHLQLMYRHRLDYSERSEIHMFLRRPPTLDVLHRVKEKLHQIYRTHGNERASKSLDGFIEEFKNQTSEPLTRLARTLRNWRSEILEHLRRKLTKCVYRADE